jgi:hypothetical protein
LVTNQYKTNTIGRKMAKSRELNSICEVSNYYENRMKSVS